MEDGKQPSESKSERIASESPERPHKFFFGRGVTAREIAEKLWAEYQSRKKDEAT
jgi:hypothetical protein